MFFSLGSLCCSSLLYVITNTSQENKRPGNETIPLYTVRFPELLGNKEGVPQAVLNCLHSIQAHYENNGIPAKPG